MTGGGVDRSRTAALARGDASARARSGNVFPPMVIMGVQGTGKTTIGQALAVRLNVVFIDGDDLHPLANKQKMASGSPLEDEDRVPWLKAIGRTIAAQQAAGRISIVACSALKRWYRELLRHEVPGLLFAHLIGDRTVIEQRIANRHHEYMPTGLLDSQIDTLEPLADWEHGVQVDVAASPEAIVDALEQQLERCARPAPG